MSSGCGWVNGWWAGIGRPSSVMASNSGKSTTHSGTRPPSLTGGRPRSSRSAPSTVLRPAPLTRDDQHEVAGRGAERADDAGLLGLGEELGDR